MVVKATYYERVGAALVAVRDGIQPEVERVWKALYGDDWVAEVNSLDNFPYDDTYRVLDTAERLLTAFNAADQVEEVRRSRQELMLQKMDRDARNEQRN